MKKPSAIPVKEIFQDKELSLVDKILYFSFLLAFVAALILVARTFWLYKEFDSFGAFILIALFLFSGKFYKKYTEKYHKQYLQYIEETQGEQAAVLEEQKKLYIQETPSTIIRTTVKMDIMGSVGGLIGLALILVTGLIFGPIIGEKYPTLFIGIFIFEFVLILYVVIYRIMWKKILKPQQTQILATLKNLKIPTHDWILAGLIIGGILVVILYRLSF